MTDSKLRPAFPFPTVKASPTSECHDEGVQTQGFIVLSSLCYHISGTLSLCVLTSLPAFPHFVKMLALNFSKPSPSFPIAPGFPLFDRTRSEMGSMWCSRGELQKAESNCPFSDCGSLLKWLQPEIPNP